MLLHFPFDSHLNDVTCMKALSQKLGAGTVTLVTDASRGKVASFNGAYLDVSSFKTLRRPVSKINQYIMWVLLNYKIYNLLHYFELKCMLILLYFKLHISWIIFAYVNIFIACYLNIINNIFY